MRPARDVRPAYIAGAVVLVGGLAVAAYLLNVPPLLIAMGLAAVAAVAFLVRRSRGRPRPRSDEPQV